MSVLLITYDLRRPGQDYTGLYAAIKSLGPWSHAVQSVWYVESNLSCAQIRDALWPHIDGNDMLVVTQVGKDWATLGIHKECAEWFRAKLAA